MRQRSPERRAEILQAATELFSAHGYESTTTREIAERVGVSEPILFRHFPTKRQLLLAVLRENGPGSRWAVGGDDPEGEALEPALRRLITRYLDMTWEHLPLFRVLWQEARRDPEVLALVLRQYATIRLSLTETISRAAAAGEVRADMAEAGSNVIGLALRGVLGRLVLRPPHDWPTERDRTINEILTVTLDGMRPREALAEAPEELGDGPC